MPNLINVPRDKEQIKEFLADGNVRGVPFVQLSDLNDGDLLAQTRTIDLGGGSYKFEITLPSGRPLESAAVSPDYSKRDATFQWLDAVKSACVGDAEQAANDAARAAREAEPLVIPSDMPAVREESKSLHTDIRRADTAPADPTEYAKHQLRLALQRLADIASAEADVERWQKVVDSLTGNVPKGTKKRKKRKHKKAPVKGL